MSDVKDIRIEDFNYPLPDERIAKYPLAERDSSKLLVYKSGEISSHIFHEVPSLLPANAMLVYNNTKVIQARMRFRKESGALIEIFVLEPIMPHEYQMSFLTTHSCTWLCMIGNAKKWKTGELSLSLTSGDKHFSLKAEKGAVCGNAYNVTFSWDSPEITFAEILDIAGELPIPPYLNRATEESDKQTYQTVYSHIEGSVAAPTAGLHFTDRVLQACDELGIERRELTLHVGAGTFRPVKSAVIGEHEMHTEYISVTKDLISELATTSRPIIAVGTTSVRTLESLYFVGVILETNPDADEEALHVPQWIAYNPYPHISTQKALTNIVEYLNRHNATHYVGSTQIMINPGYKYNVIRGMITNFHQPQSTLLLLISALVGDDWHKIYDYALSHDYRFLSYGDSSLLLP